MVQWLSADQIHIPFCDLKNVDICILTFLSLLEFLVEYLSVHSHVVCYLANPLNHIWGVHGGSHGPLYLYKPFWCWLFKPTGRKSQKLIYGKVGILLSLSLLFLSESNNRLYWLYWQSLYQLYWGMVIVSTF